MKFIAASIISSFLFQSSPVPINLPVHIDDSYVAKFKQSYNELKRLDKDWDNISKNGGDSIRRVLGTVYSPPTCESPLCNSEALVNKFVRTHFEDLDVDRFETPSSLYLQALNQADFLAYSSIFSDYGNGGGGKNYIQESRMQVKKAIENLEEMLEIIE